MKRIDNNTYQFDRKESMWICRFLSLLGHDLEEKCMCEDMRIELEELLERE